MAKRKVKRRRRRTYRAKKRRRRDTRMPLSAGIGIGVSLLAPPAPGWNSTLQAIQAGDMPGALGSFVRAWTGIYGIDGKEPFGINLMNALNPFNMSEAPAWKAMLWSGITTKLVKKFAGGDPFSRIPFVKKFVKFA